MRKAVAFIVNDRPWYFKQVLNSWEHVRDAEQWTFDFHVEPSIYQHEQAGMIRSFREWMGVEGSTHVHEHRKGCGRNAFDAMGSSFAHAEFAVLAEDDAVVSDDVLEWFEFMAHAERHEGSSVVVCAGSTIREQTPAQTYEYRSWFKAMCWGTWKDRWEGLLAPTWDFAYDSGDPGGWDCNIGHRVLPAHSARAVMPTRARCKHIGIEGGIHFQPEHIPQEDVYFSAHNPREIAWERVGSPVHPYRGLI